MSAQVVVAMTCDKCGRCVHLRMLSDDPIKRARVEAWGLDWEHDGKGTDTCPTCADREAMRLDSNPEPAERHADADA